MNILASFNPCNVTYIYLFLFSSLLIPYPYFISVYLIPFTSISSAQNLVESICSTFAKLFIKQLLVQILLRIGKKTVPIENRCNKKNQVKLLIYIIFDSSCNNLYTSNLLNLVSISWQCCPAKQQITRLIFADQLMGVHSPKKEEKDK